MLELRDLHQSQIKFVKVDIEDDKVKGSMSKLR